MSKKIVFLLSLIFLSLLSACNKVNVEDIPVFLYHSIKPELGENDSPYMVVTSENFEKDLKYLKDNGYTPIDLQTLIAAYNNPKLKLPKKPVVITFDDGYLDNYEYAYPLLKKYKSKAAIFTIVWSVGRDKFILTDQPINPHFSWEQGKEMIESGLIELGSHTFDLHSPKGLSYGYGVPCGYGLEAMEGESEGDYYKRLYDDIKRSKELMEENLGVKVNSFAYPYGIYNETVIQVLKDLEFELAFITEAEETKSVFEIRRFTVTNDVRIEDILNKDRGVGN